MWMSPEQRQAMGVVEAAVRPALAGGAWVTLGQALDLAGEGIPAGVAERRARLTGPLAAEGGCDLVGVGRRFIVSAVLRRLVRSGECEARPGRGREYAIRLRAAKDA